MTLIIFIVGFLVSSAVVYALFAYTIHEMGTNEKTSERTSKTTSKTMPELIKQPIK